MGLFYLALGYLLLATATNAATLFLSYSGPNAWLALSGIGVKLFEYYLVFSFAKLHLTPKQLVFFKAYWIMLIATAITNLLIHSQVNYVINTLNLTLYLLLFVVILVAPLQSRIVKVFAACKIIVSIYTASLFIKALMAIASDPNTMILILALGFVSDCLLVAVCWWSSKARAVKHTTSSTPNS